MTDKKVARLLRAGHIDIDAVPEDELHSLFDLLNGKMTAVYLFVLKYNDYINNRQNYADGEALTMLEAHLLTDICDNPGSTVTSLARAWSRSVSATSQTIRKLIQRGFVTRENSREDAKVFYLHATEKGRRISDMHKRYDVVDTVKTLKRLRRTLTREEMDALFKGLKAFSELLAKKSGGVRK